MVPLANRDPAFITKFYRNLLRVHREFIGGRWTINQTIVLLHVSIDFVEKEPCHAREIAEMEGMSQQAVSDALNALRAGGLVTDMSDPHDARRRLLVPTDKYLGLRERVAEAMFHGTRQIS